MNGHVGNSLRSPPWLRAISWRFSKTQPTRTLHHSIHLDGTGESDFISHRSVVRVHLAPPPFVPRCPPLKHTFSSAEALLEKLPRIGE